MPVSEEYLEFVMDQMQDLGPVTSRRMFGGAGIFIYGKMFALVADDTLYLKADDSNKERLTESGCRQFQPWPDKPAVMPYYEVSPEVLEDDDLLSDWAAGSIDAALRGAKRE